MGIEAISNPSSIAQVMGTGTNGMVSNEINMQPASSVDDAVDQDTTQDNMEQTNAEVLTNTEVSPEKIKKAVDEVNKKIKPTHTTCQFSYHEETNRISIKVIDEESKKVIREIPPEKTLDMIAKSLELAGFLVDEKR